MGRSCRLENLQEEKWEKYEVVSLAIPFILKFRVFSGNDPYCHNFIEWNSVCFLKNISENIGLVQGTERRQAVMNVVTNLRAA